jgi:hypothetical protein
MWILKVLGVWFIVSVFLALGLGKVMKAGSAPHRWYDGGD